MRLSLEAGGVMRFRLDRRWAMLVVAVVLGATGGSLLGFVTAPGASGDAGRQLAPPEAAAPSTTRRPRGRVSRISSTSRARPRPVPAPTTSTARPTTTTARPTTSTTRPTTTTSTTTTTTVGQDTTSTTTGSTLPPSSTTTSTA
jgi:hypothetical protein